MTDTSIQTPKPAKNPNIPPHKSLPDPTVQVKQIDLIDKNELADPPHKLKNIVALIFVTLFFLFAFIGALYLQNIWSR